MDDDLDSITARVAHAVPAETWTDPRGVLPLSDAIDPGVLEALSETDGDGGPTTAGRTPLVSDADCRVRLDSGDCTVRSGSELSLQRRSLWN